jgi:hypothetical protein
MPREIDPPMPRLIFIKRPAVYFLTDPLEYEGGFRVLLVDGERSQFVDEFDQPYEPTWEPGVEP